METKTLHRNIIQRLFGICATKKPLDAGCWAFENGKLVVDLDRAPELKDPGGAIRIEDKTLPERVVIVHGIDGGYFAFKNRCTHAGRRLDPVPGTQHVQCCSIGKSTFDYDGKRLSGTAEKPVTTYAVDVEDKKLIVAF